MKKTLPVLLSVIVIFFSTLSAEAANNILQGVSVKTEPDSYTIELISNKPTNITKRIISANRVVINLKNMEISENLSTKFDGNTVMDSIIVEPDMFGNLNILIQGKNIAYSDVQFRHPNIKKTKSRMISTPLLSALTGGKNVNKSIQFFTLFIFGIILICEVRFIKSKYNELKTEKRLLNENTASTSGFKDILPGYGTMGLKKPYTTPVYTNPLISRLKKFNTLNTATLNTISVNKQAKNIMSGETNINYSNMYSVVGNTIESSRFQHTTVPIKMAKLKSSIKELEETAKLYL